MTAPQMSALSLALTLISGTQLGPAGQQACPEPTDFAAASSRPVELPPGAVNVWPAVREALKRWRDSSFRVAFEGGPQDAEPPYVAMETSPAAQMQQAPPDLQSGHTCFFEGRVKDRPNTDFRIAFWFGIHGTRSPKAGRILEVRWISGIKGAGERAWLPEVPASGRQTESLARRIEALLK